MKESSGLRPAILDCPERIKRWCAELLSLAQATWGMERPKTSTPQKNDEHLDMLAFLTNFISNSLTSK
jgi:hypothetical protein